MIGPLNWFHERHIHRRRIRVIAQWIADRLPQGASLLDVGCGDGALAAEVTDHRPDVSIEGIDVLVRDHTRIPVRAFDGKSIECDDHHFDSVMMIDVLHHTERPEQLLREAARVSRSQVIIKDHYLQGFAAGSTLAFMDHVGNQRHGVEIPCNYLPPARWTELFAQAGLNVVDRTERIGLYPPPLSWLFERHLHFLAILENVS